MVERNLAKVEVAGSNPVSRSKPIETPVLPGFSFCGKEKSLAEWQSGYAAACKAVDAGSIPTSASISTTFDNYAKDLQMARYGATSCTALPPPASEGQEASVSTATGFTARASLLTSISAAA